jgi:hypothetical protein
VPDEVIVALDDVRPQALRTEAPNPAGPATPLVDQRGSYLTNGVFLYRVVGHAMSAAAEIVELEDCYGLDVVCVPAEDLRARGLRVVTPAA